MTKDDVAREMRDLQDYICGELEKLDTKGRFIEDKWDREQGGGGRTLGSFFESFFEGHYRTHSADGQNLRVS